MISYNHNKKYAYTTVPAAVSAAVTHLDMGMGPSDACDAVLLATHPTLRGEMVDRVYALARREYSQKRSAMTDDPFKGVVD